MRKKFLITSIIFMLLAFVISIAAWAGEKEELDYQTAYWQEHIKALQLDFELSQVKLKEALLKKQEFEKKQKETVRDGKAKTN